MWAISLGRQGDKYRRAAARSGLDLDGAVMCLNDPTHDRQAQTCSFGLGSA